MGKNIGKYGQKLLDHAKESATDVIKITSRRVILKTAEATGDLIGNKIADRITEVSRISSQSNSETVTIPKYRNKEIPKERHISPEERPKIMI